MNRVANLKTEYRDKKQGDIGQKKESDGRDNKLDNLVDYTATIFSSGIDENHDDDGVNRNR